MVRNDLFTECISEESASIHWCIDMSMAYRTRNPPKPFRLFLSGGAGVGKSHLVRTIVQTASRLLSIGHTEEEILALVAVFTGTAAFNNGDQTLHSVFQIPVFESKSSDYIPLASEQLGRIRGKLGNLCLLIIDEISFVSTDFLLTIHWRLTDVMTSNEPFGGISVLAVGDLFQLPPVARRPIYMPYSRDSLANLYGSRWCEHFHLVQLDKIVRQKDYVKFSQTLNRVRTNETLEGDITLLQSREIDKMSLVYPLYALHIFSTNKDVDRHNLDTLQTLTTTILTLKSEDTKKDKETGQIKEIILGQKEGQFLGVLKIAIGARISLTVNIDQTDGLVNSAAGTIKSFHPEIDLDDPFFKPKYVLVKFDDERCGINTRAKLKISFETVSPHQ